METVPPPPTREGEASAENLGIFYSDRASWKDRLRAYLIELPKVGGVSEFCPGFTHRVVPRGQLKAWEDLMVWAFDFVLDDLVDEPVLKTAFLALPGLVLGQTANSVKSQFELVLAGEFATAYENVVQHFVKPARPSSPARRFKRAARLTEAGQYRRAAKTLTKEQNGAPATKDTWDAAAYLYPDPECPELHVELDSVIQEAEEDVPEAEGCRQVMTPRKCDLDLLEGVLQKQRRLVAGGPSGFVAEHIHALGQEGTRALARLIFRLQTYHESLPAEVLRALRSSRLRLLRKPDEKGPDGKLRQCFRPIAVGELITRVTSKEAFGGHVSTLKTLLEPRQLGICTQGGSEVAFHAVEVDLRDDTSLAVLDLDLENAFGRVEHAHLRRAIKAWVPGLLPQVDRLVGGADQPDERPVIQGWTTGETRLWRRLKTGLYQGDPLSPALQALLLHPFLEAMGRAFPTVKIYAYHDDVKAVGQADVLKNLLKWSQAVLESMGARLQTSKTKLYTRQFLASGRGWEGIQISYEGIKMLGGSIGTPGFVDRHIEKRLEKHRKLLRVLGNMPPEELISSLLLIRWCVATSQDHSLRLLPPDQTGTMAEKLDEDTFDVLERMLGGLSENAREQIRLPRRMGGLGLCDKRETRMAATLASWSLFFRSILGKSPAATRFRQALDVVPDAGTDDLPAQLSRVLEEARKRTEDDPRSEWFSWLNLLDGRPHNATTPDGKKVPKFALAVGSTQSKLSSRLHHASQTRLLDNPRLDALDRTRLKGTLAPGAGCWLLDPSHATRPVWTPGAYQDAIRLLLGLPMLHPLEYMHCKRTKPCVFPHSDDGRFVFECKDYANARHVHKEDIPRTIADFLRHWPDTEVSCRVDDAAKVLGFLVGAYPGAESPTPTLRISDGVKNPMNLHIDIKGPLTAPSIPDRASVRAQVDAQGASEDHRWLTIGLYGSLDPGLRQILSDWAKLHTPPKAWSLGRLFQSLQRTLWRSNAKVLEAVRRRYHETCPLASNLTALGGT